MALQFPASPTDGQQVTLNGKVWRYNATTGLWTVPTVSSTQSVALARTEITATAGQTVLNVNYNKDFGVIVTVNGIQLLSTDYTATNGTSITMTEALAEGDEVTVMNATGVPDRLARYLQLSNPGPLQLKTGTSRWYAPQNMTITKITGRLGVAADATVTIVINKTGTAASTINIPAGDYIAHDITEIAMTETDYLTVDITAIGTTAKGEDMHITFTYYIS